MCNLADDPANSSARTLLLMLSLAVLLPIAGCKKQEAASVPAEPQTFASPQDAGKALADAANSQDQEKVLRIFGSTSRDVVSTGDAVQDKAALNGFVQAYQRMNRWRKLSNDAEMLIVGVDNQPFPIPLMKNASGAWYFDAAAGRDEILSRRIGQNEITAIGACAAAADAQAQYFAQKHEYAQKFLSDKGQQNGLYWESAQGAPRSPLGPLVAYATDEGYKVQPGRHQSFNGYYFVLLNKQGSNAQGGAKDYIVNGKMTGGFAVVAYPAQYGNSGIMTFMVNQDGVIVQKDLGKTTDKVASAITEFNPDSTWTVVESGMNPNEGNA